MIRLLAFLYTIGVGYGWFVIVNDYEKSHYKADYWISIIILVAISLYNVALLKKAFSLGKKQD